MLSKNKQKFVRQLAQKKHRDAARVFLAEGPKVVLDLLPRLRCVLLCATAEFLAQHPGAEAEEVVEISERELQQISQLKTPREVLAVFEMPPVISAEKWSALPQKQLVLALDGVQDPGNVGTIVRIADWFGIEHIFCSTDTADIFAPKTVQATMGAIARVQMCYGDLPDFMKKLAEATPIYGTMLDGEDMYATPLQCNGLLVMGNEGNGISSEVAALVNRRLYIPSFPPERPTSESLNVAIATAIVCGEFRRRHTL